jgi:solute carrier family 25 folate transporter 32
MCNPPFFTERHSPDRQLSADSILFCSAVAKMVASVATYPHEVVRTRLQTQRRLLLPTGAPRKRSGIVRTTRKILHFEGWRGLYKGLSVNLIRTVPNSAVTMLTCVLFFFLLFTSPRTIALGLTSFYLPFLVLSLGIVADTNC